MTSHALSAADRDILRDLARAMKVTGAALLLGGSVGCLIGLVTLIRSGGGMGMSVLGALVFVGVAHRIGGRAGAMMAFAGLAVSYGGGGIGRIAEGLSVAILGACTWGAARSLDRAAHGDSGVSPFPEIAQALLRVFRWQLLVIIIHSIIGFLQGLLG